MKKTFKHADYSTVENDGGVQMSYKTEDLLTNLLGDKYRNYSDNKASGKEWKLFILKCINKLEITINNTIETDTHHKFCIQTYLDQLKDSVKKNEKTYPEIVIILLFLCFELIGGIPDIHRYYQQDKYYVSTKNRSIGFSQNTRQKVNTIFQAINFIGLNNNINYKELEIIYSKFHYNPLIFLNWFKDKYPLYYAKLF